jgi:hypothetical protein
MVITPIKFKNCTSMVVDIINKTLDTTAIVKKIPITSSPIEPYYILILMVTLRKKLGTSIIFGKVDQNTNLLPLELNKSLKMYIPISCLRKTKHFLLLMSSSKLLVEQLL